MNATRKVKLGDINANLTCKLCMGYLVEATTIIECLHSFCKSCIIKYLEKSADVQEKYFCPICEIQLHETKPLTSIRADLMLQEIVYKLVPGLFKNEMSRRREFYEKHEDSIPSNQLDSGQVFDELYITSDDLIHLSLEYVTNDITLRESTRRYLKCPAAVSVSILKKFIQGKYDLELGTNVDIMFGDRILPDDFLLMDVAYKYSWTMNGSKPLTLSYRIKGQMKPIIKPERTINDVPSTPEPTKQSHPQSQKKKKVCNENGSNIMPSSDEVKNNPIKIPKNGMISSVEVTIASLKPPNVKMKNRKRKHLNLSDIVIEIKDDMKSIAKRLKLPKDSKSQPTSPYQSSATVEIIPTTKDTKSGETEEGKEVQLQISENGVMSARSVALGGKGEEQIILNLASPSASTSKSTPSPSTSTSQAINPAEKLLLSGNFHSKTGPTGVTEIICDKKPDPITGGMKSITPKPGYVTLNIPNPTGSMFSSGQCNLSPTSNQMEKAKKIPVTNLHDSSTSSSSSFLPNVIRTKSPIEIKVSDKPSNKSLLEKIRNRIASKGKDGENVIQAISDLGKLCNTSLSSGPSTVVNNGISKPSGAHTHPIISTLNSHHLHPPVKNKAANNFPFSLNFPPSSGMSVSMIPCTTSASTSTTSNNTNHDNISSTACSQSTTTPPKRISTHQTTVVNGDLKFTTSPKQPIALNGDRDLSLKKPPKFFKSRHATSPISQKSSSPQRPEMESKRKTPIHMGNGSLEPPKKKSKDKHDSSKGSASNSTGVNGHSVASSKGTQSAINFSTVTTTNGGESQRPIPFPPQSNESLLTQQMKAINGMQTDAYNSSFGLAAAAAVAAANGNGIRSILPEGFPSMPYGYGTFLSQLMVPQFYNPLNFAGAITSPVAASLNLTKSKGNSPPLPSPTTTSSGSNSKNLNRSLASSNLKSESDTASTLDLSVGKNGDSKMENGKEDTDKHPLLSRLLGTKDKHEESKKKSLSPSPKANGNVKAQENKRLSVSPPQTKNSVDKNGEVGKESSSHNGHAHENGHAVKAGNGEVQKPLQNSASSTPTKPNELNNQKESGESKDVSSNVSSLKDKDILSPSASDKLLSQNNNNNHSPDKDMGNSLSGSAEDTKTKKSLDCANQISNEGKGNCNGNNNVVPAHNSEIGSNSGSA